MSKETKQKILATAQELIQVKGCNGITISDVATKFGVSKGHVTYYFPTKKELIVAALEANASQRSKAYASIYAASNIDDFFHECIAIAKSQKTTSCLLGTVSQESSGLDKELQKKCCMLLQDWEEELISTFRRILPKAQSHKHLATFFLAQLQGALLLAKAQKDPIILVANLEMLHQMMKHLDT